MGAPSGIKWGSVVGDYGKIGIYRSESLTDTTISGTIEVWYGGKFNTSDSNNTFYYDNLATAGSATTSKGSVNIVNSGVDDGTAWASVNEQKIASYSYSYTRGTSASTRYIYAKLENVDRVGGTMYVNTSFSVPALTSYTISYNANGGSGAPSPQTKYYGVSLTLSSTKPTRTGYTFKGWALSKADADAGTWYYQAGGSCGKNEPLELYAVWEEHKLTVNYYSNYATSAFADALNAVGADKNVKVWTYDFYYDNDYSTYGLANYSNSSGSVYMTRTGYTGTGNWGTSTNGGTLIGENTGYATGQALAQALGKTLANGSTSINLYAQWQKNTYKIAYNANGGFGSMNSQTVEWQETFVLSNNLFKREGYKFVGWNLYRNADNKWYVIGQGWLTEDEILIGEFDKKLYENQDELVLDVSWIRNNENAREFTLYAIWEISGVVYIDNSAILEPYLAYIDNGSSWDLYLAYIDDGTSWHIIS